MYLATTRPLKRGEMSRLNEPSLSVVTVNEIGARFIGNSVIVTFWVAAGVIWPLRPIAPPKKIVCGPD